MQKKIEKYDFLKKSAAYSKDQQTTDFPCKEMGECIYPQKCFKVYYIA